MRRTLIFFVILLLVSVPAFAQVTVDLHALDALPNRPAPPPRAPRPPARVEATAKPAGPRPAHAPAPPTVATARAAATPAPVAASAPTASAARAATAAPAVPAPAMRIPAAPAATLPAAPPAVATIAPVAPPPPPAGAAKPPPPPVVAGAATAAAKVPSGLQLTFASGASDLSPASAAAIKQLALTTPGGGDITFNVLAYAAGDVSDPSVPRRLSLARAIAVRSALMDDGVASARIYLRALGAQGGDGPPDRVDIQVMGANAPAGAKSP